ncbi:PQQ-binding-like beta-propeller repeat protein [Actinomadura sp. WMMB 499]|uniref:serine/threonine-protein kinase n=1 Tax=Actinomadura sp. WMMB 499 TaxID=1219491 RepID=UPI001247FAC1|nr:serine/threonine-protein kinase [Actinomadura sp. WMMB 499]QFG22754.1 serine/threonine-protein kinase [Actinomadura sp. WMMB 499]
MSAYAPLEESDPRSVGRYRIVGRLGQGGMGRVYLGRSPGGRAVAVKVVRDELAEDAEFRRRFVREVAAARRVTGFFTAAVVDADTGGDPPWLATEYVPGMSLRAAVAEHGAWPEPSVRALGAALAEALEGVHGAGVVHRDLKPANVLLAPDGPRLIDFGISLATEGTRLTMTGAALGTPGFMSPEQLRGAAVGPASDVFALGAVLAYAATGDGPFGAGSAHGLNYRVVHEPPDLTGVPSGLADVVARCLAKEPGARPALPDLVAELGAPEAGTLAETAWLPEPVTAELTREYTAVADAPAEPAAPTVVVAPPDEPDEPEPEPSGGGGRRPGRVRSAVLAGGGAVAVLVIAAAAVLVSGRGTGAEPAVPSEKPDPPVLRQLWSHGTDPGSRPVVADGRLYFNADGALRAVDTGTGERLWEYDRTTGNPISIGVSDGRVYFESIETSSFDGDTSRVYALDAGSGERVWEYAPGHPVFDGPIEADGTVYFTGRDFGGDDRETTVHAVDAETGGRKWTRPVAGLIGGLAPADGTLYYSATTADGRARHLHALDARTGKESRKVRLEGDVSDRAVSLTVANGVIYLLGEHGGVLSARDLAGRLLWRHDTGIESFEDVETPVVSGGVLYLGGNGHNSGGEVVAVDARTGGELWRHDTGTLTAPPIVEDGTVYAGNDEGELHLLDARTGESPGSLRLADDSDATPAVADGVVYFDGGDGRLRAAEITR